MRKNLIPVDLASNSWRKSVEMSDFVGVRQLCASRNTFVDSDAQRPLPHKIAFRPAVELR
jgi:hypothetical protein